MAQGMISYNEVRVPSTLAVRPIGHRFEIRNRRELQRRRVASHRMAVPPRRVLVLGTGNPLRTDGGVGARTIETLQAFLAFSDNVTFVRDRALCLGLLDTLMEADAVIVIDAVRTGGRPGTLHTLTGDRLQRALTDSEFPHQGRLADTLAVADILGRRPETVMVAIEPEDMSSWNTQLTETVELRIPDLLAAALIEIERMGGEGMPKCVHPQAVLACDLVSA